MGVLTYIGSDSHAEVTLLDGHTQTIPRGVAVMLDDPTCARLLAEESSSWQPQDSGTQGLIPTDARALSHITSPICVQGANERIQADATSGLFAVALPDATKMQWKDYTIENVGSANEVTIMPLAGQTVGGQPTVTVAPGKATRALSNATAWLIVA